MTSYDIAVPLIALALAGGGIAYVRWASARLDARLEARDRERRRSGA